MKIAKKLYIAVLLASITINTVGCSSMANQSVATDKKNDDTKQEELDQDEIIAPHVFYLSEDDTLNMLDVKTGECRQIEKEVMGWEVVGDKIYYVTQYGYEEPSLAEDKNLSQNELYVMDLDGSNKLKIMGKDQISNPQEVREEYVLFYDLLGQDDEHVYFTMKKGIVGSTWGYNVVYRINIKTNQVEQVSNVISGSTYYFTAVNNHFYYNSMEPGDEWGYITEVDCATKESTVLTDYGRIAGGYDNDLYYVDMAAYFKAKEIEAILEHSIHCNAFLEHDCVKVTDENYKELNENRHADPILFKVDHKTGEIEKHKNMYFIKQVISTEETYYAFDFSIQEGCLTTAITSHGMSGDNTKVEKVGLADGRMEILDGYGNQQGRIVLGQTKEKLYYLKQDKTNGRYDLICIDTEVSTQDILASGISRYTCDMIMEHEEQLNENLVKALVQLQGEEAIIYSTHSGIYSLSTKGGDAIKLYGIDENTNWEIINKNDGPELYFYYDTQLYEGTLAGAEPLQVYTNNIGYTDLWKVAKDQALGEEWLICQGYSGETIFSNLMSSVDVRPQRLDINNVIVENGRFIYDVDYRESISEKEKHIYICDQEGNEQILIAYPEHLKDVEEVNGLVLGGILGSDVYYGIGYEKEKKGEIYKYDIKTQKSVLISTVDLEYDTNMEIKVDEEKIYIKHITGRRTTETLVLNRQTGEEISEQHGNQYDTIIEGANGDSYILQQEGIWNDAPSKQAIIKQDEQGSTEVILEIPEYINKIRFVKKA